MAPTLSLWNPAPVRYAVHDKGSREFCANSCMRRWQPIGSNANRRTHGMVSLAVWPDGTAHWAGVAHLLHQCNAVCVAGLARAVRRLPPRRSGITSTKSGPCGADASQHKCVHAVCVPTNQSAGHHIHIHCDRVLSAAPFHAAVGLIPG